MNPLTLLRVAAISALGTVVFSGLASCSSQERTATTTTHRDSGWYDDDDYYGYVPPDPWDVSRRRQVTGEVYGFAQQDQSAQGRSTGRATTTAGASRSASDQVFYFPTGDRNSSVIQLRISGPRQVQLGQPYSHNVEVTNLTQSGIADVVLRNVHHDSNSGANTERSVLGYTEPDSRRTQQPRSRQLDQDFDRSQREIGDSSRDLQDEFRNQSLDDDIEDDFEDSADELSDEANRAGGTDNQGRRGVTMNRTPSSPQARAPAARNRQSGQPSSQNEWVIGHLNPGETKSIRVEGTADEIGMINHCLAVEFSPLACTSLEVINPQLQVTARGPEEALICEDIEYTFLVRNTGTGVARNVRVVESLPTGFTTRDGRREINLPVGDIPAGESREVKVRIRASETGELQTSAIAQSELGASDPAQFTTVVQQPVLELQINGPQWVYPGQAAPFEVVVLNTGDGPAVDTVLEFNASGMSGKFQPRDLGRIEPGQSRRVSIPLTLEPRAGAAAGAPVADPGPININATARAKCVEPVRSSASARMRTMPALRLETIDLTDPVLVGQTTTYQIAVKNQGTGAARNIRLNATLPASLEFVNGTGDSRIRADGNNLVFEPIGSLNPGATAQWTVTARALSPGMTQFELRLQSDDLDEPAIESEPTRLFDPNAPANDAPSEAEGDDQADQLNTPRNNQPRSNQPQ